MANRSGGRGMENKKSRASTSGDRQVSDQGMDGAEVKQKNHQKNIVYVTSMG